MADSVVEVKTYQIMKYILAFLIILSIFPRMFLGENAINWNKLTYYTNQTNLIMAAYWLLAALKPQWLKRSGFELFRLMSVVAITITGSLYFIFLHSNYMVILENQLLQGKTTLFLYCYDQFNTWFNHLIVPIMAIFDYYVIKPHALLKKTQLFFPLIIPFAYFVFHTLRGLLTGVYVYSFINPIKAGGWLNVFSTFVILVAFTILLTFIFFTTAQKAFKTCHAVDG